MKHLWIFVVLCASSAFGQNSYGTDYLNLHCTAPDIGGNASFGDFPRAGLAPSSSVNGTAVIYCDTIAGALKVSFNGGAYGTFGGLPAGLNSPATGELDFGVLNTTPGLIKLFGSTNSATIQAVGNSTEIDFSATTIKAGANATFAPASGTIQIGNGAGAVLLNPTTNVQIQAGNLLFNSGKGQHLNTQAATNDIAGVCSGTTTTCSVTFTTNYTSTPSCVVTPTTAGVTSFIITTQANSGFTVTYAPTGTTNFNYICIGNPT